MEENVVFLLGVVEFMPLGPVITDSIRKYLAVVIKTAGRYRLLQLFRRLQFRARVLIPEREPSIGTGCCQSAMNGVKLDVVHGINILMICRPVRTVTFKREVILKKKIQFAIIRNHPLHLK